MDGEGIEESDHNDYWAGVAPLKGKATALGALKKRRIMGETC